jgi:translocation and assembly module TamB
MTKRKKILVGALAVGAFLLVLVGVTPVVLQTAWFRAYAKQKIISSTEGATGGKVQIGSFSFEPAHLRVVITDFVIHGGEPPDAAPFLRASRVEVDLRLFPGLHSNLIDIAYLGVEKAQANIIVFPDGNTNIPRPKETPASDTTTLETVIDLAIGRFNLSNGMLTFNEQKQPFDLRGNNLRAGLWFNTMSRSYSGQFAMAPIYAVSGRNTPVRLHLSLPVTLERDRVLFKNAVIASDASSITLNGSLENLRNPKLRAHLNGHIALTDAKNIGNLPLTLNSPNTPANIDLDANAEASSDLIHVTGLRVSLGSSVIEASGPLKTPNARDGLNFKAELALGELGRLANIGAKPEGKLILNGRAKMDTADRYEVTGNLETRNVSFLQGQGRVGGINLNSAVHADPHQVELRSLRLGALGGELLGDVSLQDFSRYKLTGNLAHFDIQTAARAFGQNLPYSGVISGPLQAEGDLNVTGTRSIAAEIRLAIAPERRGIPVSGRLEARYNGAAETVMIANSCVTLPHTRLTLDGALNQRVNIALASRDLDELTAVISPPEKFPIVFTGGQAVFAGAVAGNLRNPRIFGHIDVNRFAVEGRQFQDLAADVTASSSQAAVRNGTLNRSSTSARFSATAGLHNWKSLPNQPLTASVTVQSSDLGDLVALAGTPAAGYSGSLALTARIDGTQGNPRGDIDVKAANGALHGVAFDQAAVQVNLRDLLVTVPSAYIASGPSRVNLAAEFQHPQDSFTAGIVHAHLQSNHMDLAQLSTLQKGGLESGGVVQADIDATGNLMEVSQKTGFLLSRMNADVVAKGLRVEGQSYGDLKATARTTGNAINYELTSNFAGSNLRVIGNTRLVRDYPTTADAGVSHLPVQRILTLAKQDAIPARGDLSGKVHIGGTLENPTGNADLNLANAVIYDEPLDRVQATVDYLEKSVEVSRLELVKGSARINLSGRFDHPPNNLKSGTLQLKADSTNIELSRLRNVQKVRPGIGGSFQFAADGAATLHEGTPNLRMTSLNADIGARNLVLQGMHLGNATVKAATASGNRLTFALDSDLVGSTIHGQGNAQLVGDYPVDAKLTFNNVTWSGLQPLLSSGTGEPPAFEAATDGVITVSGPAINIDQLRGTMQLTRLTADSRPQTGIRRTVGLRNQGPIEVSFDHGTLKLLNGHLTGSQTDIQVTGTASLKQDTSNLSVNASVNLALLQSFDPEIVSSGAIVLNANVRGALDNPQVNGQIQLQKASVNYTKFPNGISNANGLIVLRGRSATVRNLEAETGGGKLSASGFASFTQSLRFGLRVRANGVRVRIQEGASIMNDADMRLTGGTAASTLSGTVTITQLTYAPQTDIGSILSRSSTPVQSPESPSGLTENMKLDIRVRTSPALRVQSSMAENLQASADLRVRGTAAQPGVIGRVTITEGQLVFFGSTYTVNSGSIAFYNPLRIDPILNVNLETQSKGVDVVLTVTGPIDNMKLSYTSDPPLQFQEIVGLLASGKTPTSDPTLLANQPAQPAQSLAQMGESAIVSKAIADPVSNRLQRVFGVTQLKIDPAFTGSSQLPTARLTFQQQITSNVTFTYTSALDDPNSSIIRAEWAFNSQYSAVATRDQDGLVSLMVHYKRQFR